MKTRHRKTDKAIGAWGMVYVPKAIANVIGMRYVPIEVALAMGVVKTPTAAKSSTFFEYDNEPRWTGFDWPAYYFPQL